MTAALVLIEQLRREACNNWLAEEKIVLVDCLMCELEQLPGVDADAADHMTNGGNDLYWIDSRPDK